MFHQSRKTARATMGAIGLLALLFLLAACGSVSPKLAASSLQGAYSHDATSQSFADPFANCCLAGYITTAPGTYTDAQVTFYVPTLTPTVDKAQVAYGAEIGATVPGAASVDGGIYSYLDPTLGQINKPYWEFVRDNTGLTTPSLDKTGDFSLYGPGGGVVRPGDQIFVWVSLLYYDGKLDDSFYIKDLTTGDTGSYILSGNDYVSDQSAAGCLVLSPISVPTPLANFGYVDMLGCQVWVTVSNPNIPEINLGGNGNLVMSPIGNLQPRAYQMTHLEGDGNFHDATFLPSALGNGGQDFRVDWENS